MSGRFLALVLALVAVLLLAGCNGGEASPTPGDVAESPLPTTAPLPGAEVVAEGEHLSYDDASPRFLAITTEPDWRAFWQTYLPGEETVPEVDFERAVVLVGIQGAKNTSGYDLRFTGLEPSGNQVRVIVDLEEPAPDEPVEMVLTQPYAALEVDRDRLPSTGSVTFVFETSAGEQVGRATVALAHEGEIEPTGPRPTEPPAPASEVFAGAEVLAEGESLRYEDPEPRFLVITTQQELNEFWQTYRPGAKAAPQVDFVGSFVLAGIQGNKSTGGYHIRLVGLEQRGDEVRIVTELVTPPADQPVEMAFTQPYVVVLVGKEQLATRGAFTFVFETPAGEELARMPASIE